MAALKDSLKIKYVFEYLWVDGTGWVSTVYCEADFDKVDLMSNANQLNPYAEFRVYDKNGTSYRLRGSVVSG